MRESQTRQYPITPQSNLRSLKPLSLAKSDSQETCRFQTLEKTYKCQNVPHAIISNERLPNPPVLRRILDNIPMQLRLPLT
jgi:hypothetical protein